MSQFQELALRTHGREFIFIGPIRLDSRGSKKKQINVSWVPRQDTGYGWTVTFKKKMMKQIFCPTIVPVLAHFDNIFSKIGRK